MKLNAMNELVFHYAMASNPRYLKEMLGQILEVKVNEIIPLNTKLVVENLMSKMKILDYVAETDKGIINIEINNNFGLGLIRRNITYLAEVVSNTSKRGKDYINIPDTIQINFCKLGSNVGPFQHYTMYAKKHVVGYSDELTDMVKIIIINIDYYVKMYYNNNEKFIKKNALICAIGLNQEELIKLAKENELVMEYKNKLETLSNDENFVKWISPEEEEEKIKNTFIEFGKLDGIKQGMEQGIEKGLEQGIVEGKRENSIEIAKKMLDKNMDLTFISEMTGLSIEDIQNINS